MSSLSLDTNVPFELQAMDQAHNYQRWIIDTVTPFLGQRILEVGAGTGNMSRWLPRREHLALLEPDAHLFKMLQNNVPASGNLSLHSLDLSKDPSTNLENLDLDTIVSFNVLEHIEDDAAMLSRLVSLLRKSAAPGPKRLITFVPAGSWNFGSYDKVFGHYRRYNAADFERLHQEVGCGARAETRYFNALGVLPWYVNGVLLKKTEFNPGSVKAFEKICPYWRPIDQLLCKTLGLPIGQSILNVWTWKAGAN